MESVDLEPIQKFVAEEGKEFVMGNNPRDPKAHSTFTAAEVYEERYFKRLFIHYY